MVELPSNTFECESCYEHTDFHGFRQEEANCWSCGSFGMKRLTIKETDRVKVDVNKKNESV